MKLASKLLILICLQTFATGADHGSFKEVIFDGEKKALKLGGEIEIKTTQTLPEQSYGPANACQADVSISYAQMGERIRVDTSVVNQECAASTGDYTLRIRTRSEQGEIHTREVTESWQREQAEDLNVTGYYEMGDDVDLVWVRVGTSPKTACSCIAEAPVTLEDETATR